MRLAWTLVMLLGACGSDGASTDLAGVADLSVSLGDLAGADLSGTDLGAIGAVCATACDCMPGLGCLNDVCTQGTTDIYCCTGSPCPVGAACQLADESYGTCAGDPDGGAAPTDMATGPRDMGANFCPSVSCTAGDLTTCQAFGCSMCVGGPGGMVCAR